MNGQPNEMIRFLNELGVAFELTEFGEDVFTCEAVARKLDIKMQQVAKTMLVRSVTNEYILATLPGDRQLNLNAISQKLNGEKVHLAQPREIPTATGMPLGAVTPLLVIIRSNLKLFFDSRLLNEDLINISSGELNIGLNINPYNLVSIIDPIIIDICK